MRMKMVGGHQRMGAATLALASSFLVAGCVAPLLAGVAAGGGVFGVNEGMNALNKRELAKDDRLRYIAAADLGISSERIAGITEKDWRGGILHWTATLQNGQRYKCESGAGTAHCVPADRGPEELR